METSVENMIKTIIGLLIIFFFINNYRKIEIDLVYVKHLKWVGLIVLTVICVALLYSKKSSKSKEGKIIKYQDGSVFTGKDLKGRSIFVGTKQRSMHTQVIGTTNAGKTESVILPWAIQDMQQGRGLIIIDGKSDHSLLQKLWSYSVLLKRENDFKLFSLSNKDQSFAFNPLQGGTPEEVTERVFNAFEFENPHYRSLQYDVLGRIMQVLASANITPTFQNLHAIISRPNLAIESVNPKGDPQLFYWFENFKKLPSSEREQKTSGLLAALSHFSFGEASCLFNAKENLIDIGSAMKQNKILYFQLPAMLSPFLGKATGKLVLQSLQAAIAQRHKVMGEKKFFSVFLDDFSEYLYPGFVTLLNKSRSANVGIVFAHQALGDIEALGAPIANAILTNSNVKIFMRGNDPNSAEYFSKVIGTIESKKFTYREKSSVIGSQKTGDVSSREVDQFVVHPNRFKQHLGVGEGIMILPHDHGSIHLEMKFRMYNDLNVNRFPKIPLISKKIDPIVFMKDPEITQSTNQSNPATAGKFLEMQQQNQSKENA